MGPSLALGTTLLGMFLISSLASAESTPRKQLEDFFGGVTAILAAAPNAQQGRDDVYSLAQALFDGRVAARRALGPEWDQRSAAEREEFTSMFARLVEHAYLENVKARLPRDRPPTIRILDEDVVADRTAVVRTQVQARDGDDVRLDYLMTRSDGTWRVHDVVIDDVSLVENYKAQFARILRMSSYSHLVARVRSVTGAGAGEPIAAPPRPDVVVAYFDTNRAELSPETRRDLDAAATWLATNWRARVLVEGYSDQRGDAWLNEALAERRANAMRDHLVSRGVGGDRITSVIYGNRQSVCQEPLETCWLQNRRATVRVTR